MNRYGCIVLSEAQLALNRARALREAQEEAEICVNPSDPSTPRSIRQSAREEFMFLNRLSHWDAETNEMKLSNERVRDQMRRLDFD